MISHVPKLTVPEATRIIATTPEFNEAYNDAAITSFTLGKKSLEGYCFAQVSFKPKGLSDSVSGPAVFHYRDRAWHLDELSYGKWPNVTTIK
jgi:hypothetical protein